MTARKLRISPDLSLPADVATSTTIVYGGKGMGKTNFLAVLVEECAKAGVRFSLIDPVGASWGLRHSKSGKQRGVEILVLGGRHGDYPILPTAGAIIADLVADERVNTLIDISCSADGKMWSHGEKIRFVADYAKRLYERQGEHREPLLQIIDEAGRFCPQQIPAGAPDIAKCVGAIEQLVELGRNAGVGVCLVTQRSARMNKSVSELADMMISFRTIGPRSIDAIVDWFGEHIPKKRWEELAEKIRVLPVGSALCVSPGWLEFEGVIRIRERETFDSSATPKAGEKRQATGPAAKPDVDAYIDRMAALADEAAKNDPKKLTAELARARADYREIDKLLKERGFVVESDDTRWRLVKQALGEASAKAPKVASLDAGKIKRLRGTIEAARRAFTQRLGRIETVLIRSHEQMEAIACDLQAGRTDFDMACSAAFEHALEGQPATNTAATIAATAPIKPATFRRVPPPPVPAPDGAPYGDPSVGKTGLRRMLVALAQNRDGVTPGQLSILTSIAKRGGTFRTYLGKGKTNGWIIERADGRLVITENGLDALGAYEPLPTGRDLLEWWCSELGDSGATRMLRALEKEAWLTRAALAEVTGIALNGGTFRTYLGKLFTLELVVEETGGESGATGISLSPLLQD